MDEPALLIIGVLGIVAGTAILVALLQERTIDGVRDTIGAGRRDDVEAAARGLRQGRESAEWAARRSSEDLGHLVNLVGAGIVRLDDDLIVQLANDAAQAFLDRPHGGLVGLTAIAAFGDHRIELDRRALTAWCAWDTLFSPNCSDKRSAYGLAVRPPGRRSR